MLSQCGCHILPAVELILHSRPALCSYAPKVWWQAYSPKEAEVLPLCYLHFLHNLIWFVPNNNLEVVKKANLTELLSVMVDHHSKLIRGIQLHGKSNST